MLLASFFFVACQAAAPDEPLFRDPMANVTVDGTTQESRTLEKRGMTLGKPSYPSVFIRLRASSSAAAVVARDEVWAKAQRSGWSPVVPQTSPDVLQAEKMVAGKAARLSVYVFDAEPNLVIVNIESD